MQSIDTERLDQLIRSKIETLSRHFFPAGRKEGPEWKIGDVTGAAGNRCANFRVLAGSSDTEHSASHGVYCREMAVQHERSHRRDGVGAQLSPRRNASQ